MNMSDSSSSSDDEFEVENNRRRKFTKPKQKEPKVKRKTELCNNFINHGTCKYGDKCSFAHGQNELQNRSTNSNFKTKPCKNFYREGVCSYGMRCQYMHSEVKNEMFWWGYMKKHYRKAGVPYTFPWDKGNLPKNASSLRYDILRFQRISERMREFTSEKDLMIGSERDRLPCFQKVTMK